MNKRLFFLGFFGLLILSACVPPVIFEGPQPKGYDPQPSFSYLYRGTFFCDSDSSIVHVKKKTIYKEKTYPFELTKMAIDTMEGASLQDDMLYIDSFDLVLPTEIHDDTVYAELILRDTLFNLDSKHVLTQFRGHQILNKKLNNGDWEVAILSLDEEMNLILSIADIPDDLDRLKEITPVKDLSKGDTIQYLLNPSVYEFEQILFEQLIFDPCDYYTRIVLPVQI